MSSPDLGFSVMERVTLAIIILLFAIGGVASALGFTLLIRWLA